MKYYKHNPRANPPTVKEITEEQARKALGSSTLQRLEAAGCIHYAGDVYEAKPDAPAKPERTPEQWTDPKTGEKWVREWRYCSPGMQQLQWVRATI